MNRHDEQVLVAAQRFYARHEAEHLDHDSDRLIDRCSAYLVETFGMPERAARLAAMEVRAEQQTRGVAAIVDVDRSNARMVIVRDLDTDAVAMVTVSELLQLVRLRSRPPTPVPAG
ncbi:MAG TPA: hypothetical protein VEY50_09385 [Lysobacter sp.]|nr:hypothetical protein [Lysobacter sp.]